MIPDLLLRVAAALHPRLRSNLNTKDIGAECPALGSTSLHKKDSATRSRLGGLSLRLPSPMKEAASESLQFKVS